MLEELEDGPALTTSLLFRFGFECQDDKPLGMINGSCWDCYYFPHSNELVLIDEEDCFDESREEYSEEEREFVTKAKGLFTRIQHEDLASETYYKFDLELRPEDLDELMVRENFMKLIRVVNQYLNSPIDLPDVLERMVDIYV
jgi:hypothetical protein